MAENGPIVALDAHESMHGRALYCLSSLYFCLDWACGITFRLVNMNTDNVALAAKALHWEHGVRFDFDYTRQDDESALRGAHHYVGAAFRTPQHMFLDAATRHGVPIFATVQFPLAEWLSPFVLLHSEAAFDPRLFALSLRDCIARHP